MTHNELLGCARGLMIDQNAGYVKFVCRQARKHPISDLSVYKLYTPLVQGLSPPARDEHHANEKEYNKPNGTTAYRQHRCSASDSARGVTIVGVGGG